MRQYAVAAVHLGAVARNKPDGANAVEERLTQLELIDVRRRRPGAPRVHEAWIVHVVAEAGMCFQPPSVRQIHRPSRDVVNRGTAACGGSGSAADRTGALEAKTSLIKRSWKDAEGCEDCNDPPGGAGWSNEKRSPKGKRAN